MTEFEQNLLFASTAIVLVGTLIVFTWQYLRTNRRNGDEDKPDEHDEHDD